MAPVERESDIEDLRRRLEEAEETLRAIQGGEVDAVVVGGPGGERIYTLEGADHPYRALIESMQQGAASLARDGTVLYCNRRFAEMASRPMERVIGASVVDFLPTLARGPFDLLLRGGEVAGTRGESQFEAPDGTLLPVELAISGLSLNGETALCMVVTDLTERRERLLLEEASRRKDEFLAMLAHELRNPLAPIRNALYLLKRGEVDRSATEDVRSMMERQVEHFSRLIDDLMDVSRISTGNIELRLGAVDLGRVVSWAIEISRPLFEQKGHTLSVVLPGDPIVLDADPTRIEQILDNLLTNAAKYTDPGGRIELTVSREGTFAAIRLRDDGIGIAPTKLPHIFDLFVQAERRLDRSQGGLGLGLSLVRSLVEMHGGTVSAASPGLGRGTEFTVNLPARPASSRSAIGSPGDRAARTELELPRRRVLVVDDNVDSARSMAMILGSLWGQETALAHDGPEAIRKAEEFRPDVILLDIGLPGMSGYEVAGRLRERPDAAMPFLVAVTGLGQDEDRRRSRESGFDHHMVKPVDLEVLRDLIAGIPVAPGAPIRGASS